MNASCVQNILAKTSFKVALTIGWQKTIELQMLKLKDSTESIPNGSF